MLVLPAVALWLAAAASGASDVAVEARYEPPGKPGAAGAVVAHLVPRSEDFRVNELPAPRLRLEKAGVLIDRQPPPSRHVPSVDPEFARYLDPDQPLRFAVLPNPATPAGTYTVPATLVFAYCSKQQGWCKKGVEPIELQVSIR